MKTITFDVMYDGKFIMQHTHKWCPAFPIDLEKVVEEIYEKRPSLRGKYLELYQTDNLLMTK